MVNKLKNNASGCSDPTAFNAIVHTDKEMERLNKLIQVLRYICNAAGYHIEERIVLRDKNTGKIWK